MTIENPYTAPATEVSDSVLSPISPAKRIFGGLGGFALLWMLFVRDFPLSILLLLLSAIFGPYMALTYPLFSLAFKVGYLIILLISVLAIVYGIKYRQKTVGQVAVVLGVVAWVLTGMVGLGTGS
jgi:hypothetical protein